MVIKKDIMMLLHDLEKCYDRYPSRSTYYSKLSLIEYCGWIEDSFDKIAERCMKGKSMTAKERNKIIKENHSFQYEKNRDMIMKCI